MTIADDFRSRVRVAMGGLNLSTSDLARRASINETELISFLDGDDQTLVWIEAIQEALDRCREGRERRSR